MKKVTFKPPYRVGRKSGTTVLDSNGIELFNFRDEEKAKEYVEFLNNKELPGINRGQIHVVMAKDFDGGKVSPLLMDEVGRFEIRDKEGNIIPWYVIDHVNLIQNPAVKKHAGNPLIGKDAAELWAKLAKESKDKEPCCDENNPCACATFSPNMASPEDVREFIERRPVQYLGSLNLSVHNTKEKIMKQFSKLFKKYKR